MSIFKIFFKSLYSFKEYKDLIKMSKFKTYLYIVLLSFVSVLPSILVILMINIVSNTQILTSISNFNFDIVNDNLIIEENYSTNLSDSFTIVIDKSDESLEYYLPLYSDSETLFIITPNTTYLKVDEKESTFSTSNLINELGIHSKEDVIQLIKNDLSEVNKESFLMDVLVPSILFQIFIALVSLIFANFRLYSYDLKDNISFGDSFKLTVLSSTLPTVIYVIFPAFLVYLIVFSTVDIIVSKELKKSFKEI